jgi:antitoxin MazE
MQTALRKMGNSQGVIIPQAFVAQLGVVLGQSLEMTLEGGELRLRPVTENPRVGWADAAKAIAEADDDQLVWPEFGNADDDLLEW